MSDEELNSVVEVFRLLKRWKEEDQNAQRQSILRTGVDVPTQEVRIH